MKEVRQSPCRAELQTLDGADQLWALLGVASEPSAPSTELLQRTKRSICESWDADQANSELWRLLDDAPAPPSANALSSATERVHRQLAAERGLRALLPGIVIVGAAAVFGLVGLAPRVSASDWPSALLLLAAAAVAAHLALTRRRLSLGLATLASVGLSASVGLANLAVGDGLVFSLSSLHCLSLEVVAATIPLAACAGFLWFRRASLSALHLPAIAASGALAGQAVLHLVCPDRSLSHLGIAHFGGVLVAMLLALAIHLLAAFSAKPRHIRSA